MIIDLGLLVLIIVFGSIGGGIVLGLGVLEEMKVCTVIGIVVCVVAVCGWLCLIPVGDAVDSEQQTGESIPLYALDSATSGKYLYGGLNCGQCYIGYTSIGGNSYKQIQIDAERAVLKLDDDEEPRVDVYRAYHGWQTIFPFIWVNQYKLDRYMVYIPTDGLSNTYKVN